MPIQWKNYSSIKKYDEDGNEILSKLLIYPLGNEILTGSDGSIYTSGIRFRKKFSSSINKTGYESQSDIFIRKLSDPTYNIERENEQLPLKVINPDSGVMILNRANQTSY